MRTLIFSDIHDNLDSLERLLALRTSLGAHRLVCLGDVGHRPEIFTRLADAGVTCVFGNWEVSGLRRMFPPLAAQVGAWPAILRQDDALFCHATPEMAAAHATTAATVTAMQAQALGWHHLFPRLDRNEEARWAALAALESQEARVAFHGHTHVQLAWAWLPAPDGRRRLTPIRPDGISTEIRLEAARPAASPRYLIGVGSLGAPDDGPWPRFALYDDAQGIVTLYRIDAR